MKEKEGPSWPFSSLLPSLMGGEVDEDGIKISWLTGAARCETFAPGGQAISCLDLHHVRALE